MKNKSIERKHKNIELMSTPYKYGTVEIIVTFLILL